MYKWHNFGGWSSSNELRHLLMAIPETVDPAGRLQLVHRLDRPGQRSQLHRCSVPMLYGGVNHGNGLKSFYRAASFAFFFSSSSRSSTTQVRVVVYAPAIIWDIHTLNSSSTCGIFASSDRTSTWLCTVLRFKIHASLASSPCYKNSLCIHLDSAFVPILRYCRCFTWNLRLTIIFVGYFVRCVSIHPPPMPTSVGRMVRALLRQEPIQVLVLKRLDDVLQWMQKLSFPLSDRRWKARQRRKTSSIADQV